MSHESVETPWRNPALVAHTQNLLASYRALLRKPLVPDGPAETQAQSLFELPAIVVSHGIQPDPIFNYGNRIALDTFEMSWDELTRMPSRLSAEPVERDERERLMNEVRKNGCIRNYRGIRISKSGRRFMIEDATVWNVHDELGMLCGQAAALFKWHYL